MRINKKRKKKFKPIRRRSLQPKHNPRPPKRLRVGKGVGDEGNSGASVTTSVEIWFFSKIPPVLSHRILKFLSFEGQCLHDKGFVMERMLWLLHEEDVDFINADGRTLSKLLLEVGFHNTDRHSKEEDVYCFCTIESVYLHFLPATFQNPDPKESERLAVDLKGRVKLEDAGFNWKILVEPDVEEIAPMKMVRCIIRGKIVEHDEGAEVKRRNLRN
ncbi:hypothetical protein RHSIM_Rhsim09G0050800 [Rhododendron simsii]|uniref:Uncharacterized protein n=1 Tax=Rhododendron simsii TaxID=118357 RepID=A0A834GDY2_RHOSS|nr:hypothetical protein RHSIM_Rhsim09G0050800 [Rhododendron simsii]